MKILKFSAQNVKGLRVVEIVPDGDIVTISGPNGAGKSTVLDSIERTLCGGKLSLSNGEKRGAVELDLGEYTVQRVITEKTDRLIVKNKDGSTYPSPRSFLDQFVGDLSIDPMCFVRMNDRERLDVIFRMNPSLKDDLAAVDSKIEAVRDERSGLLRDVTRYSVALEKLPAFHHDVPLDPVSVSDLSEKLQSQIEFNRGLDEEARAIAKAKAQIDREKAAQAKQVDRLHQLQKEIEALEEAIAGQDKLIEDMASDLVRKENEFADKDRIDTREVQENIRLSEAINKQVRENQDRARTQQELDDLKAECSKKLIDLRNAEDDRASLLRSARMPLEGLSVEGRLVTYHGVPMSEISTAERVRVGASIAVAQNPKAKIILCDDVSLLDRENIAALHEICSGFQVWQVVNDDSGNVGFYIEAGEVVKNGDEGKSTVDLLEMPQGAACGEC